MFIAFKAVVKSKGKLIHSKNKKSDNHTENSQKKETKKIMSDNFTERAIEKNLILKKRTLQ